MHSLRPVHATRAVSTNVTTNSLTDQEKSLLFCPNAEEFENEHVKYHQMGQGDPPEYSGRQVNYFSCFWPTAAIRHHLTRGTGIEQ